MSIIGLGFDITDIPRIADVFERYRDHFLRRVFTEHEIAYIRGGEIPPLIWPDGSPPRKLR
jgi:phosphopantetheinyl transferase (holo-ACP synthase)